MYTEGLQIVKVKTCLTVTLTQSYIQDFQCLQRRWQDPGIDLVNST